MQKFRPQFRDRGVLVDLNVAKKTESLADRAGRAEFSGGQRHVELRLAGIKAGCDRKLYRQFVTRLDE